MLSSVLSCAVSDVEGGSYENVLRAMWELGSFEDIIMRGREQGAGARTAVLFSRTADIWQSSGGGVFETLLAHKRSLAGYAALPSALVHAPN